MLKHPHQIILSLCRIIFTEDWSSYLYLIFRRTFIRKKKRENILVESKYKFWIDAIVFPSLGIAR